jgi:hypothetical protein
VAFAVAGVVVSVLIEILFLWRRWTVTYVIANMPCIGRNIMVEKIGTDRRLLFIGLNAMFVLLAMVLGGTMVIISSLNDFAETFTVMALVEYLLYNTIFFLPIFHMFDIYLPMDFRHHPIRCQHIGITNHLSSEEDDT